MARWRGAAGAAAALVALALAGLLVLLAPLASAQSSPSIGDGSSGSTTSVTTSQNLLDGPATSAAPTTAAAKAEVAGSATGGVTTSVNYKIWAVVGGLVLVALLIAWWTVHYWRVTNPRRQFQEVPAAGKAPGAKKGGGRRPSRYADLVITVPHPDDHDR